MTTQAFAGCTGPSYLHGRSRTGKPPTETTITACIHGDDVELELECKALTYLERDDEGRWCSFVDGHAAILLDGEWICADLDGHPDLIDQVNEALQTAALEDAGLS